LRHAFSFPAHIREAVREYVRRAVSGLDPARYEQEPAYTAALLGRLEGVAYNQADGSVVFKATNVNSIGPGAAEDRFGADLAITAEIRKDELEVVKAILAQAKRGGLQDLAPSRREELVGQIQKMRHFTHSPKVVLYRDFNGQRVPEVASGIRIMNGLKTKPIPLPDYFVRRILPTLDGDTRPDFVAAVQESSLGKLEVIARVRSNG
jgi:hypothetical protein